MQYLLSLLSLCIICCINQTSACLKQPSPGILLSNKGCRVQLGPYQIIAEDRELTESELETYRTPKNIIELYDVGAGWGNGAHPTTKLCFDFILKSVKSSDKVLDYGTGSGILSIAAIRQGASKCVSVDIDDDTLIAAEKNAVINGVDKMLDIVHTRQVYVGEDRFPVCDVTVANILPVSSLNGT